MEINELLDIAYKYCGNIANDDDLEKVIKEMIWILNDRREQEKYIQNIEKVGK